MVFQDPQGSLNPRQTCWSDSRDRSSPAGCATKREGVRVRLLLSEVGLNPEHINRFPHEFSGGQRQSGRSGPSTCCATEPDRPGRTGFGLGRVHPGAGDQPALGLAARIRDRIPVRRTRSRRLCDTFRTVSPSCTSASSWRCLRPRSSTTSPCTPIRRRCCPLFPSLTFASSASPLLSRASRPRDSNHRQAADSTLAVAVQHSYVGRLNHRWSVPR